MSYVSHHVCVVLVKLDPPLILCLLFGHQNRYTEISNEAGDSSPNNRLRKAEVMSEVVEGDAVRWWEVSKQQYPCNECCGSLLNK